MGLSGTSDGSRLHSVVFFSSVASGLNVILQFDLDLAFLDFGLDFAQSFPFHAQFCHFGLVFSMSSALSAVTYTSVYTDSELGRPVALPSPDNVPGPEHPLSPVEVPYVPEPEYHEYLVPSDAEEDPEGDHVDYPADGGDGDDEPSDDDDDDDDDDEEEEEEPSEDEDDDEEEHLAPVNSSAIPVVDPVPSVGDTEAFETDEYAPTPRSPQIRVLFAQTRLRRARKIVRLEPPMSPSMEARIAEHVATPTPPLHVASPPLPLPSPFTTSPTDTGAPLGYRAAGIWIRATVVSPPLLLLSTSHRTDIPEAEMLPRKRACLATPATGLEIGESSVAGVARQPGPTPEADTWDEIIEAMMEVAPTTLEGVNQRVTELDTTVRHRTKAFQDRPYHHHTAMALDKEVIYDCIAWTGSEERIAAIEAHVRTLEAQVATLIAQTTSLQTQLTTTLRRIETLEARDPEPQDGPAEKMPLKRRTTRATPTTTTTPTTTVTDAQLQALIDRGVVTALSERDASSSRDSDNNHGSGTGERRQVPTQQECTYTDFLKCQPMNFKGTEGVVSLTQWVEKIEYVFLISNCAITSQVKYASCTLQGSALTWWNFHVRAIRQDVAYALPWTALKRMITDKYFPRGEIKKLESEYWNLRVRGSDLLTYNQRFQELALMCDRMFPEESAKVERYIGGLLDMIHGSVKASKPQSLQEAIKFATEMMDKKMLTAVKHQAKNKRKFEDTLRNNQNQQQPFKRNNVTQAYTVGPGDKKPYGGTKPLCHFRSDCPKLKNGNQGNQVRNGNAVARAYAVGSAGITQTLMLSWGCPIFLAHVTTKKAEDKSEEKRLKDVPIVQDFPE
ncbi:putative reverse transcriptase domain-containing protein, partial [Tanacetum coccineum]